MKKEKEMDMSGNRNNNANNQLLKEYIKLQIENLLKEQDDYDIADDGQQLSGNAKFITSLLGLKGIYDIGKVAAGVAESIIKRVFGEAWILVKRLWYTLNPYYFAMSSDELNNIISGTRKNLENELRTVRNEYSGVVDQANRVLENFGTDLAVVNFMTNPIGSIGTMAAQGAYDSAGWALQHILPRNSPAAAQNAELMQELRGMQSQSQESESLFAEQNQPQMQDIRSRYATFLNSPEVRRAIESSPFVQQIRRAYQQYNNNLVQNIVDKTRQKLENITFENLRRSNQSKWNETLQDNPNLFDSEEKKNAFVQYAREQIRNNAIQQIQQIIRQNSSLNASGQQAIQQIQQIRIR